MTDAVNPNHYKTHASGVECIQVIYPLYYGAGNAIKYLWRLGMKDEDVQELEKAWWYVIHSAEADMPLPDVMPFDSVMAFELWYRAEPAGYRKDAIYYIYTGNYAAAEGVIHNWIAKIKGIAKPSYIDGGDWEARFEAWNNMAPVVPSVHNAIFGGQR